MITEAAIDRIADLVKLTNLEFDSWQEWLTFSDVFFFIIKSGSIEFVDFVDKLFSRLQEGDQHILRTNHVTWLLAQIIRVDLVMNALNTNSRKVEITRKILSFHKDASSDPNNPKSILLDFITSCQNLRIWSLDTSTREYLSEEQLRKGKEIDEWWRQTTKGEQPLDYMNMDERSIGMFWVVSYTMAQPACESVMNYLASAGVTELLPGPNLQSHERFAVMHEVSPLPIALLSGLSINLCLKLSFQIEESMFNGQVVPNIAMVETYCRLLLIIPHALFRPHLRHLTKRNPAILTKPGVSILLLEIMNYRLLSLYRYHWKSRTLMYDITKIMSPLKGKRGDHRIFRLAENLCMNLLLSMREFFIVKREGKGQTEFTETLNRVAITTLAIIIKTRGITEFEHLLYLPTMLEQILATSQHAWSDKTLRYFPSILCDALVGRTDKRGLTIQPWQQLCLPACTGLRPSGVIGAVKLLTKNNHGLKSLRINGIYDIQKEDLEILHQLIDDRNQPGEKKRLNLYHEYKDLTSFEHSSSPIDVDICPKCNEVRVVFDCPRDSCKRMRQHQKLECRGCQLCIPRCEECGVCIKEEDPVEAACADTLCLDCWLQLPKCNFCNKPYCNRHADQQCSLDGFSGFVCTVCRARFIDSL